MNEYKARHTFLGGNEEQLSSCCAHFVSHSRKLTRSSDLNHVVLLGINKFVINVSYNIPQISPA
jgi:hypothetical protein